MGRGNAAWPAAVEWPAADRPTIGERIMTAAVATAEKAATAVAGLFKPGEPMAPVVTARLVRATEREAELAAKVAALALDELVDPTIAQKREKLELDLAEAKADVVRLRQAERQAMERDARAKAEAEIVALQAALEKYESFAIARIEAAAEMAEATRIATEAGRKYQAATALLQDGIQGHALPRGLVLGRSAELSVRAVKDETDRILEHMRTIVRTSIAWKRGEEIEHDD
jgi:hypothetical protein